MFSLKSLLVLLSCLTLAFVACEKTAEKTDVKTPGIYHIRLELGNYWAGREDEIYFDYDSTMTKQQIHYFKYDAADSIIYNQTYEVEKAMMDSVFIYAVAALRNEKLFAVDKYEPKDVNTMRLEIIANERMLATSYNNVLKPSLVSPEFKKLVRMINKCVGDSSFVK
ncbi:MAG: hypothetical protein M3R17_02885 [Bacteroidota bacterium]|nr:hypothetical protein [Bacteroidota bacterium]